MTFCAGIFHQRSSSVVLFFFHPATLDCCVTGLKDSDAYLASDVDACVGLGFKVPLNIYLNDMQVGRSRYGLCLDKRGPVSGVATREGLSLKNMAVEIIHV